MNQIESSANRLTGNLDGMLRFFGAFSLFGLSIRTDCSDEIPSQKDECVTFPRECDCGGYNEAFFAQHWANYDPIR